MAVLNKSDILQRTPTAIVVEVGDDIAYVRSMTGGQRDIMEGQFTGDKASMVGVRARVVTWCLCDEGGSPLMEEGDLEAVGGLDARFVDTLFQAAMDASGLGDEAVEDAAEN